MDKAPSFQNLPHNKIFLYDSKASKSPPTNLKSPRRTQGVVSKGVKQPSQLSENSPQFGTSPKDEKRVISHKTSQTGPLSGSTHTHPHSGKPFDQKQIKLASYLIDEESSNFSKPAQSSIQMPSVAEDGDVLKVTQAEADQAQKFIQSNYGYDINELEQLDLSVPSTPAVERLPPVREPQTAEVVPSSPSRMAQGELQNMKSGFSSCKQSEIQFMEIKITDTFSNDSPQRSLKDSLLAEKLRSFGIQPQGLPAPPRTQPNSKTTKKEEEANSESWSLRDSNEVAKLEVEPGANPEFDSYQIQANPAIPAGGKQILKVNQTIIFEQSNEHARDSHQMSAVLNPSNEAKPSNEEEQQDLIYELSNKSSKNSFLDDIHKQRHQQRSQSGYNPQTLKNQIDIVQGRNDPYTLRFDTQENFLPDDLPNKTVQPDAKNRFLNPQRSITIQNNQFLQMSENESSVVQFNALQGAGFDKSVGPIKQRSVSRSFSNLSNSAIFASPKNQSPGKIQMVKKQKPQRVVPKQKTPVKGKKKMEARKVGPYKVSPAKRVKSPLSQKSAKQIKNTPKAENEAEGIQRPTNSRINFKKPMDHTPVPSFADRSDSLRPTTPSQTSKQMLKSKSQSRITPLQKVVQPLSSPKSKGFGDFDEGIQSCCNLEIQDVELGHLSTKGGAQTAGLIQPPRVQNKSQAGFAKLKKESTGSVSQMGARNINQSFVTSPVGDFNQGTPSRLSYVKETKSCGKPSWGIAETVVFKTSQTVSQNQKRISKSTHKVPPKSISFPADSGVASRRSGPKRMSVQSGQIPLPLSTISNSAAKTIESPVKRKLAIVSKGQLNQTLRTPKKPQLTLTERKPVIRSPKSQRGPTGLFSKKSSKAPREEKPKWSQRLSAAKSSRRGHEQMIQINSLFDKMRGVSPQKSTYLDTQQFTSRNQEKFNPHMTSMNSSGLLKSTPPSQGDPSQNPSSKPSVNDFIQVQENQIIIGPPAPAKENSLAIMKKLYQNVKASQSGAQKPTKKLIVGSSQPVQPMGETSAGLRYRLE